MEELNRERRTASAGRCGWRGCRIPSGS